MATLARHRGAAEGTRFFLILALVMTGLTLSGFVLNVVAGRSSFGEPLQVHVHGIIFMAWLGFYIAQHMTAASGNFALHRQLGKLAYLFIPAMMVAGTVVMVMSARARGGPFFFAINEFLISNVMMLFTFGGLTVWALKVQRHTGWHRRLMLIAMSVLTGPGLGRLIPTPLLIPYAWQASIAVTWILPLVAIYADWRRDGRVHPAYWWGFGIYVGMFAASMALAYSPLGYAITGWVIAGTPGAERPMAAFLPPGFGM